MSPKDCMEEINLFSENKSHLKQLGEQLLLASDEAKQTQVHGSLLEVNQRWHNLFHQIEARWEQPQMFRFELRYIHVWTFPEAPKLMCVCVRTHTTFHPIISLSQKHLSQQSHPALKSIIKNWMVLIGSLWLNNSSHVNPSTCCCVSRAPQLSGIRGF